MKRVLTMMLFLVTALIGYAGNQVKGELRTEINGFQWYCYKGKQAFSIDGKRLFPEIKGVESIKFSAADKDDIGAFIITYKEKGLWHVFAVDPYTYKKLTSVHRGRQPHTMFSVVIMFSNPTHKEYYIKVTHPIYSHSLIYLPKNVEIQSQNSFVIKDNYIITDGAYRGACRYDGKIIVSGYIDKITYQEKAKHFICDIFYPSKSICIIDTTGNKLAENLKNVCYKDDVIELSTKNGKNCLISYSGKQIVPPEKGYSSYSKITINYRTFYCVKYENESCCHLISDEGNDILGRGYDIIEGLGDIYIKVKDNINYGIVTLNGKEIIPISRGYTYIGDYNNSKGTFAFTKKGYSGICDAQGREISLTRLAPTVDDIMANGGYASAVKLKDGSTKYYKVSKNGRYGMTDAEGKIIVPVEMEALESAGTGYVRYKLNGFWGLMNYQGKVLIDTNRGYTSIGDYKSFNKRFAYTMNGYKGECDATGKQISKIKVDTPRPNTSVTSSSASSSTSSNTSNNTRSTGGTQTIVVEHKHDPVPMQVWKQCTGCYGSGMCQSGCGGSGWFTGYSGNSTRCIGCGGSGKCQFCAGQGGHYEVEYR